MWCGRNYDVSKQRTSLTPEAEYLSNMSYISTRLHGVTSRKTCMPHRHRRKKVKFRTVPLVVRFMVELNSK